jgi:hypothetical protein
MYDSLPSLVRGWGKNVYAGGRHAMRGGRWDVRCSPCCCCSRRCRDRAATGALAAAARARRRAVRLDDLRGAGRRAVWSALATLGVLATAGLMRRFNREPWRDALLAPWGPG